MTHIEPFAGFGLGLRRPHYHHFLEEEVELDFVEVISENFMVDGGNPLAVLDAVRCKHEVVLHGVSLSPGSAHGVDRDYLARLKTLADRIEPLWMSDHLCWTRSSAHNSHDLLPLPYTAEALGVICDNIMIAQDILQRPLLLENPSSYMTFPEDEMREWEFLAQVTQRTSCYLLLDVNNIYVSAHNHGFSAQAYVAGLPLDRVRQIHLAGHTPGEIAIDTHDREVCGGVWDLLAHVLGRTGPAAIMIERDDAIPPLADLLDELAIARRIAAEARQEAAAA
ncbi:MNIO family bufferin maturase [Novosphingobium beihaiensis]|uniref:DUF692 domain-containing protein n=1 Tax=Novosphingobium beihaiensis TaxID=2930389 RepID=A0ABT0BKR5_9SPHN|nr:DUF692 domain-containing protein [Novosphingobium beihaiensis]MCJ2185638.1 DUF692 domain-containing protein [Novosphingobium beihaiensis]